MTGAEGAPESVTPTGDLRRRLDRDVHCLAALFAGEEPAERTVWAAGTVLAAYLVGNASGDGFGSVILEGGRVEYQADGWGV